MEQKAGEPAFRALGRGKMPPHLPYKGYKSLETTMGYFHAESLSVRSPLETILP